MRLREGENFLSLRSLLSIDYWLSVGLTWIPSYIRALWNECCDTKTNIITTANQLMSKYYKKTMKVTTNKRLEARKNAAWQTSIDFYLNLIGWKLMWHIFLLDQSCWKIENLILSCVVVVQLEAASKQYLNADPSPIEASAFQELIFAFYQIANYFGASYT